MTDERTTQVDPNETLQLIRALAAPDRHYVRSTDYDQLCELVVALDEWLAKGGFLPEPWTSASVRTPMGGKP